MRQVSIAIIVAVLYVLPALAGGIPLYKGYSFGQSRADIQGQPGVISCEDAQPGALCLGGQPFADSVWLQMFSFVGDRLVQVSLADSFSQDSYMKAMGAILNNGYIPVCLQSGDHTFDFIAEARAHGKKSAAAALTQFEQKALDHGHVLYSFIPRDMAPLARESSSFADFVRDCPDDMRSVEMEIKDDLGGPWIAIRFFAAKATRQLVGDEMVKSSDKF